MHNSKRIKRRKIILLSVSILLMGILSACGNEDASKKESSEPITVNVAINGINIFSIIKEKGFLEEKFKQYNATIIWSEFPSGPPLLESLAAGRVDISLLGDGAALQGQSSELPFVNIALLTNGEKLNSVLVSSESDIKTVADLKGKKIALAKGTTGHVFLLKLLEKHGLKEKDLTVVNLQYTDALPAFLSGQVDAWATGDPFRTQLTFQKKATVLAGEEQGIKAPLTLIAHTDFAKKHPELVIEFLNVYRDALRYQSEHVDEVAQIYTDNKKIPFEIMKIIVANQDLVLTPITDEAIATQQASSEILLNNGFLKKEIVFKDYVDNSFIEKQEKK